MSEMNYFYFKEGKTLLCVRVHPIIYFLRNLYDGIHVLSMATVLNVGTPQVAILVHHFIFFFCTFLRTVKLNISFQNASDTT